MVLSNAERQARFRRNLKARASGESIGQLARDTIDEGLAAMWASVAPNDAMHDQFASLEELRAYIAADWTNSRGSAANLREFLVAYSEDGDASPDNRAKILRALEVVDAAHLMHVEPLPKPKRTRR